MPRDAWSFFESLGAGPRTALTRHQAEVAAICDLRQAVNSGGFDSYFRYDGGNTAPQALAALPSVLGEEWADLLVEAMGLLGPDYPTDARTREARLDDLDLDEVLDGLDVRFFALEQGTDADARTSEHLAEPT